MRRVKKEGKLKQAQPRAWTKVTSATAGRKCPVSRPPASLWCLRPLRGGASRPGWDSRRALLPFPLPLGQSSSHPEVAPSAPSLRDTPCHELQAGVLHLGLPPERPFPLLVLLAGAHLSLPGSRIVENVSFDCGMNPARQRAPARPGGADGN